MLLLGAALLVGQELPGNAIVTNPAPQPQNVTVHNEITVQAPPPDPQAIADASVTSSEAILSTVIVPPPLQWANDLMSLPDVWRTTPDDLSWNNGAIRDMAGLGLAAALSLVALAIFAAGAGHALGQGANYGRLLLGVVLAVGNLAFWQIGIGINNTLNNAIGAPALPSLVKPHLVTTVDPGAAVGTVVLLLVYAIVVLLLIFSLLFRLGLIDILIAVGSLALLMYATEQTEFLATHYTRLAVGVLFGQVLIVFGLRVASVLGTLGGSGLVGTLVSIAVLLLIRDLPKTLIASGGAGQGQGRGMGLTLLLLLRRRIGL